MAGGVTLVTGGTGFLGRHLLRALATAGSGGTIRVLTTRAPQWLKEAGAEICEGSIMDPAVLARACAGVETIYHLAGLVSRDPDDQARMYEIHVEGTRRLCAAAQDAGVRRMVLCSSSGTIAVTKDGKHVPDETHPVPLDLIASWPYYLSKLYQERTARGACAAAGIELVIVHPSLTLGPGDERMSSSIDVQRLLDRLMPAMPPGGLSFVDVRDVAATLPAAMAHGRPGESYLLGGANWTCRKFFERVADLAGVKAPLLTGEKHLFRWGGAALDAAYRHFGRRPPVDRASAEMGTYFWYVDASKAIRELGFVARDPSQTLADTIASLRHGTPADPASARV
jgi:dihydroflavonol-4-reductase